MAEDRISWKGLSPELVEEVNNSFILEEYRCSRVIGGWVQIRRHWTDRPLSLESSLIAWGLDAELADAAWSSFLAADE